MGSQSYRSAGTSWKSELPRQRMGREVAVDGYGWGLLRQCGILELMCQAG